MIAIVKTGGKQYIVKEGEMLKVEKLAAEVGTEVSFEVMLVGDENGAGVKVGQPFVAGAKVEAKVLEQGKNKKVVVQRYKNKTRYRRLRGHRQPFTKVQVTKITA
ncbi:MAG: 50S ribosomal protein L21 [bacterium]